MGHEFHGPRTGRGGGDGRTPAAAERDGGGGEPDAGHSAVAGCHEAAHVERTVERIYRVSEVSTGRRVRPARPLHLRDTETMKAVFADTSYYVALLSDRDV